MACEAVWHADSCFIGTSQEEEEDPAASALSLFLSGWAAATSCRGRVYA